MSKTIQIQFKPLYSYFFGGEETFGFGDNTNYYARSRKFPQQTTVLGVLRHLLYLGGFDIGPESFNAGILSEQNFGHLHNISTVRLIQHKDGVYRIGYPGLCGMHGIMDASRTGGSTNHQIAEVISFSGIEFNVNGSPYKPFSKDQNFDVKQARIDMQLFGPEATDRVPESQIFIELNKVGIQKNTIERSNEDKSFHKQQLFILNNSSIKLSSNGKNHGDFAFACFVTCTEEAASYLMDLGGTNLYMGGEKSGFVMTVVESSPAPMSQINKIYTPLIKSDQFSVLILLSDTWLKSTDAVEFRQRFAYAMSETDTFRNIYSPPALDSNSNFSDMGSIKGLRKKKKALKLLKAGTAIWADQNSISSIKADIDKEVQFKQIGYNQFLTIDK